MNQKHFEDERGSTAKNKAVFVKLTVSKFSISFVLSSIESPEEEKEQSETFFSPLNIMKRYFFVVPTRVLIILPRRKDRLLLQKIREDKTLSRANDGQILFFRLRYCRRKRGAFSRDPVGICLGQEIFLLLASSAWTRQKKKKVEETQLNRKHGGKGETEREKMRNQNNSMSKKQQN